MVRGNSLVRGNGSATDNYLRGLHEFRVAAENSLLEVVTHLIGLSENDAPLPSAMLAMQAPYLQALAAKYPKRSFAVRVEGEDAALDALGLLVRRCRKKVTWDHSDLHDLLAEHPDALAGATLPDGVVAMTLAAMREYNKRPIPSLALVDVPVCTYVPGPAPRGTPGMKYDTPFRLYANVLAQLAKFAIDFDLLKAYDFLVEERPTIRSAAFAEVLGQVSSIGFLEYGKPPLPALDIAPGAPRNREDRIHEEWGSNLRRTLTLRDELAGDFVTYMSTRASVEELRDYRALPALRTLAHRFVDDRGLVLPPRLQNP